MRLSFEKSSTFGDKARREVMAVIASLRRVSVSLRLAYLKSKNQADLNSIKPCLTQQQHMAAL